jgi:hypothetical protein
MKRTVEPGVKKDELEIEAGAKHKHVAMQLDFGDGAARQRMSDGDEANVLVAPVERRWSHVHWHLPHLQVTTAVYHLLANTHTLSYCMNTDANDCST